MRFTRLLLSTLFVTLFAAAISAQQATAQACKLNVEQAPELRGLRLGMTVEQVRTLFPNVQVKTGQFGTVEANLNSSGANGPEAAALKGISSIYLGFVDERLTRISILYQNQIRWESNEQFAARVAEALKLPAAWKGGGEVTPFMECDGFVVSVYTNNIGMKATKPYQVVQQRQREQEERERQSFQP